MMRSRRLENHGTGLHVMHIGSLANQSGGITRVARQWVQWDLEGVTQHIQPTTHQRGRRHDLSCVWRAWRTMRNHEARALVVHAHLSQEGAWREGLVMWLARLRGVRVVAHLHGSRFVGYSRGHPVVVRSVLRAAHIVLCLTGETERAVNRLLPAVTTCLTHNYCEPSPDLERAEKAVVFAGAVGRRKGVDVLLDAWGRIPREVIEDGWELVIIGPLEPDFEPAWAQRLPTDREVTLVGPLSHARVLERLRTAAVAVLPSRAEAFPVFLLEAMASGAVPVGTEVGDVSRLLGGVGRLVPPDAPDALAGALLTVMSASEAARQNERAQARDRVATVWTRGALQMQVMEAWLPRPRT